RQVLADRTDDAGAGDDDAARWGPRHRATTRPGQESVNSRMGAIVRSPMTWSRNASATALGTSSGTYVTCKRRRPGNWLTTSVTPSGGQQGPAKNTSSTAAPQNRSPTASKAPK